LTRAKQRPLNKYHTIYPQGTPPGIVGRPSVITRCAKPGRSRLWKFGKSVTMSAFTPGAGLCASPHATAHVHGILFLFPPCTRADRRFGAYHTSAASSRTLHREPAHASALQDRFSDRRIARCACQRVPGTYMHFPRTW
jgi:hypothetical protein